MLVQIQPGAVEVWKWDGSPCPYGMGVFRPPIYFLGGKFMNTNFFKTWSPNMAWLLGYTWADGCVQVPVDAKGYVRYRLRYGCSAKDVELLLCIYRMLGCVQKIAPKKDNMLELQIGSKELVCDLIELHGVEPRKSYKDLSFPSVPSRYLCHFVRGYFDGDGSAYQWGGRIYIYFSSPLNY